MLLLPLRNPHLLAREALTVAELTGGRFDLGVGLGWSAEEFAACESDFTVRGKRSEKLMNDLSSAWNGDRRNPSRSLPADTVPPRVLVGGQARAAVRRAATVADGWYPWNLTPTELTEGLENLEQHLAKAGRSRDDVHVIAGFRAVGELEDLSRIVARYAELGVDGINISLRMTEDNYAHVMSEVANVLGLPGLDA